MKTLFSSIICVVTSVILLAQTVNKDNHPITDTIEYIKRETLGGKLDFRSVLKAPDDVIDHNGVRFNKNDYYVFLWGQAISDAGLASSAKAEALWEEIHGQRLTNSQRTALRIGFEKKLK